MRDAMISESAVFEPEEVKILDLAYRKGRPCALVMNSRNDPTSRSSWLALFITSDEAVCS